MRRTVVVALAVLLLAVPAGAAGAASPFEDVTITIETWILPDGGEGYFSASGDALEAGLVCEFGYSKDTFTKSSPREGVPPNNFQILKTFYCDADDVNYPEAADGFVLKLQVRWDSTIDDPEVNNTYSWTVVSGWGEYEGLKGNGKGFGEGLSPIFDTFEGKLR